MLLVIRSVIVLFILCGAPTVQAQEFALRGRTDDVHRLLKGKYLAADTLFEQVLDPEANLITVVRQIAFIGYKVGEVPGILFVRVYSGEFSFAKWIRTPRSRLADDMVISTVKGSSADRFIDELRADCKIPALEAVVTQFKQKFGEPIKTAGESEIIYKWYNAGEPEDLAAWVSLDRGELQMMWTEPRRKR